MSITCPKCGHCWFPKGRSPFKKCPNCGQKIRITGCLDGCATGVSTSGCLSILAFLLVFGLGSEAVRAVFAFYKVHPILTCILIFIAISIVSFGCYLYFKFKRYKEEKERSRQEYERAEMEYARLFQIKESLMKYADDAITESEILKTHASKINRLRKAQEYLGKALIENNFQDDLASEINSKLQTLSLQISSTSVGKIIEQAAKHEFTGNISKAVTVYKEALFTLLNDDVPDDDQSELIRQVKARISTLEEQQKK